MLFGADKRSGSVVPDVHLRRQGAVLLQAKEEHQQQVAQRAADFCSLFKELQRVEIDDAACNSAMLVQQMHEEDLAREQREVDAARHTLQQVRHELAVKQQQANEELASMREAYVRYGFRTGYEGHWYLPPGSPYTPARQ